MPSKPRQNIVGHRHFWLVYPRIYSTDLDDLPCKMDRQEGRCDETSYAVITGDQRAHPRGSHTASGQHVYVSANRTAMSQAVHMRGARCDEMPTRGE